MTKQDLFFENGDTSTVHKKCDYENRGSVSDLGELSEDTTSISAFDLSAEFALTSSPYETRLSDWISELSNVDHSEILNYQNETDTFDHSGFSYLDWTPEDSLSWDRSGFLWDMN